MTMTVQTADSVTSPPDSDTADTSTYERSEDAAHTVNAPHAMPKWMQDFVRLQNERKGLDTGDLIHMLPDFVIEDRLPEGMSLKKLKSQKKKDAWKRFLKQLEDFIQSLAQTYEFAASVKIFSNEVKNEINAVLEQLKGDDLKAFAPKAEQYKAELAEIKAEINETKQALASGNVSAAQVQQMNTNLANQTNQIQNIATRFRTRVSNIVANNAIQRASASAAAATTAASPSAAALLRAQHAAAMPGVHLPVTETMHNRFDSASHDDGYSSPAPSNTDEDDAKPKATDDIG